MTDVVDCIITSGFLFGFLEVEHVSESVHAGHDFQGFEVWVEVGCKLRAWAVESTGHFYSLPGASSLLHEKDMTFLRLLAFQP